MKDEIETLTECPAAIELVEPNPESMERPMKKP